MVVLFVLSLVIVTDRKQLARNVDSMRDALNAGKFDEALKFFDDKVTITALASGSSVGTTVYEKSKLVPLAKQNQQYYKVKKISTGTVAVNELSRPHAKIRFLIIDADDTV